MFQPNPDRSEATSSTTGPASWRLPAIRWTADGNASLNSIAKKASVERTTLDRHFPSRESLVLGVYRAEVQRLADWTSELLEHEPLLTAFRQWSKP